MNTQILLTEFEKVKRKGFIKTINQNDNGVGRTFEELLGIRENAFGYADYYGIEIKCTSNNEERFITLFSLEPESLNGNVITKIAVSYGYKDKKYNEYNVLNTFVNANKTKYISLDYKATLYIDSKRINLLVYDKYDFLVDYSAAWTIERLFEKIINKCMYLAVIKSTRKKFDNCYYVRYDSINIYKFKNIDLFIEAIEKGIIIISFKISLRNKKGTICHHNHGTSFMIKNKDIPKVFEKIV